MLPRLSELRRLPQILDLVTLAVRHATSQAVRGFGRGLQGSTQGASSVIDTAFRSGVLVRDASCSLPVGRHAFLCLRGLALNFECSMQRLLCIDANYFMSCTSVANFSEGVAKFNARVQPTSLKILWLPRPVHRTSSPDRPVDGLDLSGFVRVLRPLPKLLRAIHILPRARL